MPGVFDTPYTCNAATASLSFSLKSFSASVHTRAVCLLGNSNNDGSISALNCSDASRGSNVGRWSIDIIESGGTPSLGTLSVLHQRTSKSIVPKLDGNGRIRKGGIDAINGYGVERIGGVTTDIDDNGQPPRWTRRADPFSGEERGDVRREIDAIDEDINIEDLLERPALGCLCHIPLEDVVSESKSIVSVSPHMDALALTRRGRSCGGGPRHHVHIVREHQSQAL